MQWLAMSVCLLAAGSIGPSKARAQGGASAVERWHPEAFIEPGSPQQAAEASRAASLALELDEDGFRLGSEQARTGVRRARIAVGVSAAVAAAGALMAGGAVVSAICFDDTCPSSGATTALLSVGSTFAVGGLVATVVSSVQLRRRKRAMRERVP